ncbi:MAG TPA: tetratricopeptide repeat protein [Stellaceae bacterium]|nr:tetratricopeptide repeat protein [Stellaceae bacterium]
MAEERVERRLAAILCADVAGYSRLMGEDEEGTLAALKAHRRELLDPVIAQHQGRLVKTTGDGMLIEFFSVVDAVRGAVAVQQEMERRNEAVPEGRRIRFRIGINLGDIIVDEGDIFGDGVNVAARLENMAEPGTICISAAVREQLGERLDLAYADLGEHLVKNIARPIRIYRIGGAAGEKGEAPAAFAASAHAGRPSIAVLRFANMSGDADQEYFADGMVEDIITGLSHITWLGVIARNSSFHYGGVSVDLKQVGRELGVRYVLEGSVRKLGNRVRITAQLVEADNGRHLWAERYDRDLTDIFALQDDITMAVVGAIEPSVRAAEIERVRHMRPDNLDAYDLILRALPLANSGVPGDAERALPLLQRAIELEPRFGGAHALLARCYQARYVTLGYRAEDKVAAIAYAHEALSLGRDDAASLASAGFIIYLLERDVATANEAFERALSLNPSSSIALCFSALTLAFSGKTDLAIERAERAIKLSPFDPLLYGPHTALAAAHCIAGRPDEAIAAARRAIQINPRFPQAQVWLIIALVQSRRIDEAKTVGKRLLEIEPTFTVGGFASLAPEWGRKMVTAALSQAELPP